jgi:hypothetical protein
MGLKAVAAHRWGGIVPVGAIFTASVKLGRVWAKNNDPRSKRVELKVLR